MPTSKFEKQARYFGLLDELEKISGVLDHATDLAGLGILAAPNIDNMVAKYRARKAGLVDPMGHPTPEGIESKRLIPESFHDPIEVGGLGVLAVPAARHILRKHGQAKKIASILESKLLKKLVLNTPGAMALEDKIREIPDRQRKIDEAMELGIPVSHVL